MSDPTFILEIDEFEPELARRFGGARPPFRPVRPRRPRPRRPPLWRVPPAIAYPIPVVAEPLAVDDSSGAVEPAEPQPAEPQVEPAEPPMEPTDPQQEAFSRRYSVPVIGDRSGFQEIDTELEKGIIDDDTRQRVMDTKAAPYRFICHLLIEQKGSNGAARTVTGTGVLISNSHVLTCGHNLKEAVGGTTFEATRIAVSPGKDTSRNTDRLSWTPFGSHVTTSFKVHPQWGGYFDRQYDYALITLKKEVGKKTFQFLGRKPLGYWGNTLHGAGTVFAAVDPQAIRDREVFVCGYPYDKCGAEPYNGVKCPKGQRGGTQFVARDKVIDPRPVLEHRLLYHKVDTKEGQSGGPIWRSEGTRFHLVGIESSSEYTFGRYTLHNVGVRITTELLDELKKLGWRV